MEILFIWILDYKNIKEQGFNFSSEFIFEVEKDEKGKYTLNILENENFIPNFFDKDNILNVTAIVGQNGSGKSNILEFIKTSFPKGYSMFQSDSIIVYRRKEEENNNTIILLPNEFSYNVNKITDIEIEIKNGRSEMPDDKYLSEEKKYSNAEYIFYSNIFDFRIEEIDMEGFHNISTLGLLKSDFRSYEETAQYLRQNNSYDIFKTNEIKRNIQFLLSDHTNLLDFFPLPETLFIEIINLNYSNLFYEKKDISYKRFAEKIVPIFNEKIKQIDSNTLNYFICNLRFSMLFNILISSSSINFEGFSDSVKRDTLDHFFNDDDDIISYTDSFFKTLQNLKYKYEGLESPIEYFKNKIQDFYNLLDFLSKELENETFTLVNNNLSSLGFEYKVKKETNEKIKILLQLYINAKGFSDFLNFNWRNLSSGEQSFFSLISRFYDFKYHQIHNNQLNKNIVILIDEGDIYFHPEWQKRFFKITIDFLSELLKDHQIQLIYTSNTPFITSDLPKSNIIFIEKNDDGSINVHGANNDRKETFGGNIHTLFADSFYMKGALMGEFAKNKINEIIAYLNEEKEVTNQKKKSYKKTIDIIGEPILKKKLQEMWYDRFGVDEEIDILRKRIEELENNKALKKNEDLKKKNRNGKNR